MRIFPSIKTIVISCIMHILSVSFIFVLCSFVFWFLKFRRRGIPPLKSWFNDLTRDLLYIMGHFKFVTFWLLTEAEIRFASKPYHSCEESWLWEKKMMLFGQALFHYCYPFPSVPVQLFANEFFLHPASHHFKWNLLLTTVTMLERMFYVESW